MRADPPPPGDVETTAAGESLTFSPKEFSPAAFSELTTALNDLLVNGGVLHSRFQIRSNDAHVHWFLERDRLEQLGLPEVVAHDPAVVRQLWGDDFAAADPLSARRSAR